MRSADFFARGEWNFYCDLCGSKQKSSYGRKTWDGFWVCAHHNEVRNPQDFVKGVKDNQTVPWTSPNVDQYVPTASQAIRDVRGEALLDKQGSAIGDA
jgi:hypothetical protein